MTLLAILLTVYALAVIFQAFLGIICLANPERKYAKSGARLLILLPLAPLVFLRFGLLSLRKLYRLADFKDQDTK